MWVLGTERYLGVYYQMKTISFMTVLKVVDYSTYCSRLVMDWLQGYEHAFNSREFKETFSPQRETVNAISSIYRTLGKVSNRGLYYRIITKTTYR